MTELGRGINYTPARGICHEVVRAQVEHMSKGGISMIWEYVVVMRFPTASKVFVLGLLPQPSDATKSLEPEVVGKLEELVKPETNQNHAGAVRLAALPPNELDKTLTTLREVYPDTSVIPHPDYYQNRYSAPLQAETASGPSAWVDLLRG